MNTPFKMTPGRSPFLKTGRNIPLQMCSPAHQTDPASGLEAKAKALAEEKLKKNIEAKPLGGSTDVRKETATVSNIKLATTAEEIAKWKAGKDKPGAGRFNQSASAEATAQGMDMPREEEKKITPNNSSNQKMYFFSNTNQNFGSNSTAGLSNANDKDITSLREKNVSDTNMSNAALGSAFTTGKNNLYAERTQTPDEARLVNKGILSGNYNPASDEIYNNPKSYLFGTKRRSSEEQLANALKREKVVDAAVAKKTEFRNNLKAEQDKKRAEIEAKKKAAQKPKTPTQQKATMKKSVPIKQMKKETVKKTSMTTTKTPPVKQMGKKAPMKMKKC